MAHKIFISYRREDSGWSTQALYTALIGHFGDDQVFMDLDDIRGGDDWVSRIETALQQCGALLAVIGSQWLTAEKDGIRRLDDPADYLLNEISTALQRDILVIPILVDGTGVPNQDDLPDALKPLVRRNAISLNRSSFSKDVEEIVEPLISNLGLEAVGASALSDSHPTTTFQDVSIGDIQTETGGITAFGGVINIDQREPVSDKTIDVLTEQIKAKNLELQQQKDWISQLIETNNALAQLKGEPDSPVGIEEAQAKLTEGNTEAAEAIFQQVADANVATGSEAEATAARANANAAEAYRHIGALAFLHDTEKALNAYRRATELDPNNPVGWNQRGHLEFRVGNLSEAEEAYQTVLRLGESNSEGWAAASYGNLGNVYQIRGDLEQAETMYEKSLALNEKLGRKEGMAASYGNLGNFYKTRGDLEQAKSALSKSLKLYKKIGATRQAEAVEGELNKLRE